MASEDSKETPDQWYARFERSLDAHDRQIQNLADDLDRELAVRKFGRLAPALREIVLPISGTAWPILRGVFPMTEEAWIQMIAVLEVFKPGLVESVKDEDK